MITKKIDTEERQNKINCSDNILDDYIDADIEYHKLWDRARCDECNTNCEEERINILNTGKCSMCQDNNDFSLEEFINNQQYYEVEKNE